MAERPEIEGLIAAAQAAWPGVEVDDAAFAAELQGRLAGDPNGSLHTSDLYLAFACARGDQVAVAIFLREMVPHIEAAVLGLGADAAQVDEVRARLVDSLLVAEPGASPGIASYAGRGQLRSWVRSIAVRMGMRQLGRIRGARAGDDALANLVAEADDPEIEHLKTRYGTAFRAAFAAALAALTARQRNLLRQHYLDELTVDQLGGLYRVHRATAARWVAAAREALFDDTRRRMIEALGLPPADYDSLLRLLHSQIDLSIQRFLAPQK